LAGGVAMATASSLARVAEAQADKQPGKPMLVFVGHEL
jgi:hypothetical protein